MDKLEKKREANRIWMSQWRKKNIVKARERNRLWATSNPEKVKITHKNWVTRNVERKRKQELEWRLNNKERKINADSSYYKKNSERIRERVKTYAKNNPEKVRLAHKTYLLNNPNAKLAYILRNRVLVAVKNQNTKKCGKIGELIGCSVGDLRIRLESQFKEGMSWENHGKWHIDHVKPCASFDLSNPKKQKEAFNYSNLQPLWAFENLSKGAKLINT